MTSEEGSLQLYPYMRCPKQQVLRILKMTLKGMLKRSLESIK